MRGAILAAALACCGCRMQQAAAQVKDDGSSLSTKGAALSLSCALSDMKPAANGIDDAMIAPLKAYTGLSIAVPARVDGMTSQDITDYATLQFQGGDNPPAVTQALDLYDRAGTLAQVSGALTGGAPDYAPTFTAKIDLNTHAGDGSGFATLVFYSGPVAITGSAQVKCSNAQGAGG